MLDRLLAAAVILVIDNYDSFTYNLVQYLLGLGAQLEVVRNDALSSKEVRVGIEQGRYQGLLISPGLSIIHI